MNTALYYPHQIHIQNFKSFTSSTAIKYFIAILVEQETKTGLHLGWVFRWVYPVKPAGFLWYVPRCHNVLRTDTETLQCSASRLLSHRHLACMSAKHLFTLYKIVSVSLWCSECINCQLFVCIWRINQHHLRNAASSLY